jgi:mRNA interferase HigB
MRLVANKTLRAFWTVHPMAEAPFTRFRKLVEKTRAANFAELKAVFKSVDKVGEKYVFNIGANKYRLVASIAFRVQTLWVKAVMTHDEYDEDKWK